MYSIAWLGTPEVLPVEILDQANLTEVALQKESNPKTAPWGTIYLCCILLIKSIFIKILFKLVLETLQFCHKV